MNALLRQLTTESYIWNNAASTNWLTYRVYSSTFSWKKVKVKYYFQFQSYGYMHVTKKQKVKINSPLIHPLIYYSQKTKKKSFIIRMKLKHKSNKRHNKFTWSLYCLTFSYYSRVIKSYIKFFKFIFPLLIRHQVSTQLQCLNTFFTEKRRKKNILNS